MFDFALHPDSALVDHPSRQDVFAPWQAATIVGMHILAVSGLWLVSVPAITAFVAAHLLCLGGGIALGIIGCWHTGASARLAGSETSSQRWAP
jgi:hypothetical protein